MGWSEQFRNLVINTAAVYLLIFHQSKEASLAVDQIFWMDLAVQSEGTTIHIHLELS